MEEAISTLKDDEPSSSAEAANRLDWKQWEQAIQEEKKSLQRQKKNISFLFDFVLRKSMLK